jgi:hypothetical protein
MVGAGFTIFLVLAVFTIIGIPAAIVGGLLYRPMKKEFGRAGAWFSVFIGLALFVGSVVLVVHLGNQCGVAPGSDC